MVRDSAPAATRFIGREADLSALVELASSERLVTILGPPGVGKTRLARELARRRGAAGRGAAWFCDLTEARGEAGICAAVAAALGVLVWRTGVVAEPLERLALDGPFRPLYNHFADFSGEPWIKPSSRPSAAASGRPRAARRC